MPSTRKKPGVFRFAVIVPGSWTGEIGGTPRVHFGQSVQPGPPPRSVKFTYLIIAATLLPPDKKFRWPGVVMCWAPTPMKTESSDAGVMFGSEAEPIPILHLTLEVTRPQFSDMLRFLETARFKEFYFTIEDGANVSWPIRSWGMTTDISG